MGGRVFMSQRTPVYDSAEMALRGTIGAHRLHATHDSKAITANARAAFNQRFLNEVDPDRVLPEEERERRAGHAKKAYYLALALKSAQARAKRKRATTARADAGNGGAA